MKQSKRILKLLEVVPVGDVAVDVGADHGILTKLMLSAGRVKYVYATDISAPSLNKTKELIEKSGLCHKCTCLVADGLSSFDQNFKADSVIIAGMGGNEIIKILIGAKNLFNFKHFILQPVQDYEIVRKFLSENNFVIEKDCWLQEKGKYYAIIVCHKCNQKHQLSDIECYFGANCMKDKEQDFIDFVIFTYNKLNSIKQYLTQKDLHKLTFCEIILNK